MPSCATCRIGEVCQKLTAQKHARSRPLVPGDLPLIFCQMSSVEAILLNGTLFAQCKSCYHFIYRDTPTMSSIYHRSKMTANISVLGSGCFLFFVDARGYKRRGDGFPAWPRQKKLTALSLKFELPLSNCALSPEYLTSGQHISQNCRCISRKGIISFRLITSPSS